MQIFARPEFIATHGDHEPALLLEGDWPSPSNGRDCDSLDRAIDARHGWVDVAASELAERLAIAVTPDVLSLEELPPSLLAYFGALRLSYYGVKLLRWIAYCREVRRPRPGESWHLHVGQQDQDYVDIFKSLCRHYRLQGEVCNSPRTMMESIATGRRIPTWRRWLNRFVAKSAERTHGEHLWRAASKQETLGRRVLLGGDIRLLEPLAAELLDRGHRVAWLCDEPVLRSKLRAPGIPQLACESSCASHNSFAPAKYQPILTDDGIDLGHPVERWLNATRDAHGACWTRWLWAIDHHVRAFRPDTLVLTEDATPFTRAAVLIARHRGVRSIVAQHGAPCVRFGFVPLAADHFAAWDEASREQLIAWGAPTERMSVCGSLPLDRSRAQVRRQSRSRANGDKRCVLLLANLPARDERPDAVEFHLTGATYAKMIQEALTAVAAMDDVQLIIKLHPRAASAATWTNPLKRFPALPATIVSDGPWTRYLVESQAVLSFASSAGIEAARLGWPVVQLLPEGAGDVLSASAFGLIGSAHSVNELRPLLEQALQRGVHVADDQERTAAARLAALVERPAPDTERSRSTRIEDTVCLRT